MKIIFFGTPQFALTSLQAIVSAGYNVAAIVTMPDKASGRGMHLHQSIVKEFAIQQNIKLLQPVNLKAENFIKELENLNTDLQIVIAFRMLPEVVWNMPRLGTLNLHASVLPNYRGAAPINWAIINGEKMTGVSTFFLKYEIDTGDILLKKEIEISGEINAGELHDKLMNIGADAILESLKLIESGTFNLQAQAKIAGKLAPKIFKKDCLIDFNKKCHDVYNLIRGLSPYPTAFTYVNDKSLKIYSSKKEIANHENENGFFLTDNKTFLKVACVDGFIHLLDVQMEGKKRMEISEFLKGFRLTDK